MIERSVLLASNYNAWPEVFNGQSYAFLNVVSQVENADLLAPEAPAHARGSGVRPTLGYLGTEFLLRSYSQVRRLAGRSRYSPMQTVHVEKDYDVFFYMCQAPMDLAALASIKGWRERSGIAVAYILETWSRLFDRDKAELRLLDDFDHVFVLNAASIPKLGAYTKTPCTFLASATDCLLATPFPDPPPRTIDVFSMGRGSQKTHQKLVELAQRDPGFLYVFDTLRRGAVVDWSEQRALTAKLIKRSRFFEIYAHSVPDRDGSAKSINESCLSTRYFEGAAGGAVLIGSASPCPEYKEHFDWTDALIEVPSDPRDMGMILADLVNQPERLAQASLSNATQCLRRHDWGHRWAQILECLGLEASFELEARLGSMQSLADAAVARGTVRSREPSILKIG